MTNHVIQSKDEDFLPWLANFASKLIGYAALLSVAGQPEVRRYKPRFIGHSEPVGDYSDVVIVTIRP